MYRIVLPCAFVAATLVACVTHNSPAQPIVIAGPASGEVSPDESATGAAELEGGSTVGCAPDAVCNFDCPTGGCSINCAAGSTCNVDCEGGGCNLNCGADATCNLDCAGGGCVPVCAEDATCNVD